jgi:hypothetical protein
MPGEDGEIGGFFHKELLQRAVLVTNQGYSLQFLLCAPAGHHPLGHGRHQRGRHELADRQGHPKRKLVLEVYLGLLLGHDHHAHHRLWRHRCHYLPGSAVPDRH